MISRIARRCCVMASANMGLQRTVDIGAERIVDGLLRELPSLTKALTPTLSTDTIAALKEEFTMLQANRKELVDFMQQFIDLIK